MLMLSNNKLLKIIKNSLNKNSKKRPLNKK